MSVENDRKINLILGTWASGTVQLTSWLTKYGFSNQLLDRYKKSRWLESIGTGAMIRYGDKVGYEGAIYALQKQARLSIHPGGKTALSMLGRAHYLELSQNKATLFGGNDEKLPAWFKKYDWGLKIDYYPSSFLPANLGLIDLEIKPFYIKVSSPARAIMECLYLAPEKQDLIECYQTLESLNNLRPDTVQELLEQCTSVKVKRLFLYMSEKAGHSWFKYLKCEKIDLGIGKRSIVKGGTYIPKYQITVPKELEKNEKPEL